MPIEQDIEQLKAEVKELKAELSEVKNKSLKRTVYTVKKAAEMLNISPACVNYHIRKGKIKAIGGRNKKITEEELLRYMEATNYK